MGRAPCCEKVGLKRGRWTTEEDDILNKFIQANGEGNWRSLPKNAGLLRCGKSCRLRWINYLRGDLKRGNISVEEESLIVKLHASFGNRWSLIASHMPGRTDNEIKNYWNSHLSRKVYSFRGTATKAIVDTPPKRRRCGRTSRWAMKKNKLNYSTSINVQSHQKGCNSGGAEKEENVVAEKEENGGGDEKESDEILLELWPEQEINDDEVLSFHEFMDTCLMEPSEDFTTVDDDLEGGRDTCTVDNMVVTSGDSQSQGGSGSGELHYSCSSNSLAYSSAGLDVMELNHREEESVLSMEPNENLLTWLWEDEDWEKDFQTVDAEKQNDMVHWFLS